MLSRASLFSLFSQNIVRRAASYRSTIILQLSTTPPFPPATSGSGRGKRVLYADDMKQLRELITIVLTREGYVIETAVDGQEALERLRQEPAGFDLLITDHHMPRMNGLELVSQIRQLSFPGKIIVFSSELGHTVNHQYRNHGVDLILPKPIFPLTLRKVLAQLFTPAGTAPVLQGNAPPDIHV